MSQIQMRATPSLREPRHREPRHREPRHRGPSAGKFSAGESSPRKPSARNFSGVKPGAWFVDLALAFRGDLYRISLKLTGNHADAEDLVQDVYVRILRYAHRFQEGTDFRAWALTILRTTFIDRNRKTRRTPAILDPDDLGWLAQGAEGPTHLEDFVEDYHEAALDDAFHDDVLEALRSLPWDFRQAFLMATVAGLSYEEIANRMRCPDGTVRSRICRSRRLLRQSLTAAAS